MKNLNKEIGPHVECKTQCFKNAIVSKLSHRLNVVLVHTQWAIHRNEQTDSEIYVEIQRM